MRPRSLGGAQSRLEGLLADRARAEDELSDAAGRRESAVAALYRLQGALERLALRSEPASELLGRVRDELGTMPPLLADGADPGRPSGAATRRRWRRARLRASVTSRRRRAARARAPGLARAGARGPGRAPAGSARLGEQERDWPYARSTRSRARARRRGGASCSRVGGARDAPGDAVELLERARSNGLGSLTALAGRDPQELVAEFPIVPFESLPTRPFHPYARATATTPACELWFAGETAEAVLLELEARRRELAARAADLERGAERAVAVADEAAERSRAADAALARVVPACGDRRGTGTFSGARRLPREALGQPVERPRDGRPVRRTRAHVSTPARSARAASARSSGASAPRRSSPAGAGGRERAHDDCRGRARAARRRVRRGAPQAPGRRRCRAGRRDDRDELTARVERLEARRPRSAR